MAEPVKSVKPVKTEIGEPPFPEPHVVRIETKSREETAAIGSLLGQTLHSGDTVCLDGDLGAGKTAFTSGIAHGMGVCGVIASPTFTILLEHTKTEPGGPGLPLYHFDAYRLMDAEDFYNLGFEEYLSGAGVCVIEWADRIRQALPEDAVSVLLRQGGTEYSDLRVITVTFPRKETRTEWLEQKINDGDWRKQ